jgi:hypothetical protein
MFFYFFEPFCSCLALKLAKSAYSSLKTFFQNLIWVFDLDAVEKNAKKFTQKSYRSKTYAHSN